jgi:hypothetical protein
VVVKHILREPDCLVEFSGEFVHKLFNFLINSEGDQTEVTLVAKTPFINANVKILRTVENGEVKYLSDFSNTNFTKKFRMRL